KAMISYEGIQRVETYPIPPEALREAVLNAITHKDYGSGIPIQISVFEDRIRIWNNGQLPEGWSIKHLTGTHQSQPYNPDIANTFFRAGMIEAWGRGIERIMAACRANKTPIPSFMHEPAGLWVEFPYRMNDTGVPDTTQKSTQKSTQESTQKILAIIRDKPTVGRREIAELLGDVSENSVKYLIERMKEDGIIRRIGPTKGGHWEIIGEENDRRR
ncbi:ATP-binding protein, partial [Methanocalculus sp.]|uniref:ATP-binding protein n=1 Tax=Methanocalculus sp. TaxID=2004547 RepID=UPI00271AF0A4